MREKERQTDRKREGDRASERERERDSKGDREIEIYIYREREKKRDTHTQETDRPTKNTQTNACIPDIGISCSTSDQSYLKLLIVSFCRSSTLNSYGDERQIMDKI